MYIVKMIHSFSSQLKSYDLVASPRTPNQPFLVREARGTDTKREMC